MAATVTVKWGKNEYRVELDAARAVIDFKAALYSLTAVPPDRQRLMCKAWKGVLKEDTVLAGLPLDGAVVSLMGSADVAKPTQQTQFVEDMAPDVLARVGHVLPAGLENLGNTCYANSALQCLRAVPELREAIVAYRGAHRAGAAVASGSAVYPPLVSSLGELYATLDGSTAAAVPAAFLSRLRAAFPQFGERGAGPTAGYKQQDSEEFTSALLAALAAELRAPTPGVPELNARARGDGCSANVLDTLFGVEFEETLTCKEAPPPGAAGAPPAPAEVVVKRDFARRLQCNIDGGAGKAVQINHLHEGIALGLGGDVEKAAASLGGRNALWSRSARLDSLPRYLCVQMMRFFWKQTPESQDHAGVKCKMLRPVSFPETLDLFDFVSDRVRGVLQSARERYADEHVLGKAKKARTGDEPGAGAAAAAASAATAAAAAASTAMQEDEDELAAAIRLSTAAAAAAPGGAASAPAAPAAAAAASSPSAPVIGYGLPPDFRGLYELFALVTHKGRSADSGHYMGWRRGTGDAWLVFDDESVSETTTEFVTAELKGGGDQHTAYLLFFRAKA